MSKATVYDVAERVFGRQVGPKERICDACRTPHERINFAAVLQAAVGFTDEIAETIERRDSLTFEKLAMMIEKGK